MLNIIIFIKIESDQIKNHGLPSGLIPESVECFSYDDTSCLLEVRLCGPCYAHYEDGLAHFDSEVRGNLSYTVKSCSFGFLSRGSWSSIPPLV
ncbi:hypothetical protein ZIOFF_073106 [Zingiber officinale]|uniref:Uncharacterized protein n=1 Tax=Zingiber officinale TaxID=94328 RepID=A0A8J5EP18_ZINOF|nr:hypothetical protein ZIOFF_073106 [Zingiber officinale]